MNYIVNTMKTDMTDCYEMVHIFILLNKALLLSLHVSLILY